MVTGFIRTPFNDIDAVRSVAEHHADVIAVLVEPVQGEAGILVPYPGYLRELRSICDEQGWLLMLDEVQSGMCRSGHFYACQGEQVRPDVLTTAKALGNGVPIGACLASGPAAGIFEPGSHGSTYGGNPLACAAALAVLDTMQEQQLAQRAAVLGRTMLVQLRERLLPLPEVAEVRGRGLLIGIELSTDCTELVGQALEQGYLINVAASKTIRLLPPLVMDDQQCQQLIDAVCNLVSDFAGARAPRAISA